MTPLSTSHMNNLYVEIAPEWLAFLEVEEAKIQKELQRLKAGEAAESEEKENDRLEN